MAVTYDLEIMDGYGLVVAQGVIEGLDELGDYIRRMLDDVYQRGLERVLVDHRHLAGDFDISQKPEFALRIMELAASVRGSRWAVVTSPERRDFLYYFETVARNRGFMVLAFDTPEEAETWLLGDLPAS